MEKMDSKTKDFVSANISELKRLFPQCVKEGQIDFEELKELLGTEIISDGKERYMLNWFGKKDAKKMALLQTTGTLRPCKEESVNWDKTQNMVIEGDNLEALRAMSKSYAGEIKMIYIDPPYNTGNDFVYKDDFSDNVKNYVERSEQSLEANPETNGRFHSTWLDMIYPRLKLAQELLRDDGVIFVSIDDNEVHNLRLIMNEIFGEENFIAQIVWRRRVSSGLAQKRVSVDHEYVMAYQKQEFSFIGEEKDFSKYDNPDNDPRGPWILDNLTVGMSKSQRPHQHYVLVDPKTGREFEPNPNRVWAYIPESMEKKIKEGKIYFPEDTKKRPMLKRFQNELKIGLNPISTWASDISLNAEATREIQDSFGFLAFNYAKPVSLIEHLIKTGTDKDAMILDFFAGSGTTAHAVLAQNAQDGGKRKFILVQIPEPTPEDSEARKAGYKNIAEITKERIRRVIKKIKEEQKQKNLSDTQGLDLGFKVFKLDTTNIRAWDTNPENLQSSLENAGTMIKDGRSSEDVLYEMLLKYGSSLTSPIKEEKIGDKTIFDVGEGYLYVCFDNDIGRDVITHIVKLIKEAKSERGTRVLFADKCFKTDQDSINAEVLLRQAGVEDIRRI